MHARAAGVRAVRPSARPACAPARAPARPALCRRAFATDGKGAGGAGLRLNPRDMLEGMEQLRRLYRKHRPVRVSHCALAAR